MIGEATRWAVCALLAADAEATEDERRRVALAMAGDYSAYSVVAAAKRLGVTPPTLYAMIRAGKIERLADGRISGMEIERYFANTGKAREEATCD